MALNKFRKSSFLLGGSVNGDYRMKKLGGTAEPRIK